MRDGDDLHFNPNPTHKTVGSRVSSMLVLSSCRSFGCLPPIVFPAFGNRDCHTSILGLKQFNLPQYRRVDQVHCYKISESDSSRKSECDPEEWETDPVQDDAQYPPLDVESLEKEARDAVREHFKSLSYQAAIGKQITNIKGDWRKKLKRGDSCSNVPTHRLPKVAIVGRPNVGKSALFNRLVAGNKAIVLDEPGVTRDRLYGRSSWDGKEFIVVDTGGVHPQSKLDPELIKALAISSHIGTESVPLHIREAAIAKMPPMIEQQATLAVKEACVVIFLVDGQAGVTAADEQMGVWLRKYCSSKHVILVVNKCESPHKGTLQAMEFWSLGFPPLALSVISGRGIKELLEILCSVISKVDGDDNGDEEEEEEEEENRDVGRIPSLAIVGRPNVGKSSILNALLGEERAIVSPIGGTTRDAIDTEFTGKQGQKYRLVDTAGIRKKGSIASSLNITEALSVGRSLRAISRSDVVALVIEAMVCVTDQDYKIADRIVREGKGCLIVVNKWDTIRDKDQMTSTRYEQDVRQKLRILDWAPIVYSTALSGDNIDKIISGADVVVRGCRKRLSTGLLNQVVREAVAFKSPPRIGRRGGRVYYCTQAAISPPTFVFFINHTKFFPSSYKRYLENKLRSDAGFFGTPIRLFFRTHTRRQLHGDQT